MGVVAFGNALLKLSIKLGIAAAIGSKSYSNP